MRLTLNLCHMHIQINIKMRINRARHAHDKHPVPLLYTFHISSPLDSSHLSVGSLNGIAHIDLHLFSVNTLISLHPYFKDSYHSQEHSQKLTPRDIMQLVSTFSLLSMSQRIP